MEPQLIKQAHYVLSKCGKPKLPGNAAFVDIPHGLIYNVNTPASSTFTGTRNIPGDTNFMLRAISGWQDSDTFIRIQWPDGSFFNFQIDDLSATAWAGSFRRSLSKELMCPPGSLITVTTDTHAAAAESNVALVFEGVYRYAVEGVTRPGGADSLADMPRYRRSPNGNILAPEWALDMHYREIPPGKTRGPYTLVSPSDSLDTTGGQTTIEVPADSGYDFLVRRFTFEVAFDNGVTGELLVKPRDGSGYAMFNDYAPYLQVQDAPYAMDWCIKAGSSLFFDFLLRNTTGSGSVTFSVNVHGARQRRAA